MKKNLKKLLVSSLTKPPASTIASKFFGSGIPIFMLHRFETHSHPGTSPAHLRHCLQYLVENGYNFISLESLINALNNKQPLPPKSVVFTIDDGFADQVEIAAPIFLEFDCPVTIFLITGMLDGKLWPWDDKVAYAINNSPKECINVSLIDEPIQLPLNSRVSKRNAIRVLQNTLKAQPASKIDDMLSLLAQATECSLPDVPPHDFRPMTWDMAREYESKGVLFAPHTVSHRILSKLDANSAEQEIIVSWQRLQEELTSPSPVFCYPTGRYCDYSSREIELLKKAGFIGAVSTYPAQVEKISESNKYLYQLPRFNFPSTFTEFMHDSSWMGLARNRADPMIFGS